MSEHRIYTQPFSKIYQCYVDKAERKGRMEEEVRTIFVWFTGYSEEQIGECRVSDITLSDFLSQSPHLHPKRVDIHGVVCGVCVEDVAEPMMREIRRMDKLIDELAKGKSMDAILRS